MKVLGLGTEGDSGAALIEDGSIVAAINEERLSRLKLVEGFPRGSIGEVLRLGGARPEELSAVLIAGTQELFVNELKPFEDWFGRWNGTASTGALIKRAAGRVSRLRKHMPFLETGYYALLTPSFMHRRRALRKLLRDEFGVRCPIHFVDHHLCHVTSAYYTSGFRDALVVSMDGGGDGRSTLVYAVRDGRFEYLDETSAFNSLGNYYAYVTALCGFTAMKHEGKVTGLAAHGKPRYVSLLRAMIDERDGSILNHAGVVFREAIREIERRLPRGWKREDLAASIQRHFEDVVCRYVSFWAARSGLRDVAAAGGVFANVRVNQEVHELPHVDRLFVHPHMGDGGLAVGAGLAGSVPGILERSMPAAKEPLEDAYLGNDLGTREIDDALRDAGLQPQPLLGPIEEQIAELLADGRVVVRATGRMEYGPRALGNRSILYQPADRDVNDWLNRNLKRTEFMPFAPAVLSEKADMCFAGLGGAEHAAEFMTITFDCSAFARQRLPGVVHVDGTARPQLVRQDRNPGFHAVISAFHRRTGLPAVINTSFNMHEEPIVCTARDCVRAFLEGRLDYLAIGPYLIEHPRGIDHPLRPVAAQRGDVLQ
jgi:carbamoyltransferase